MRGRSRLGALGALGAGLARLLEPLRQLGGARPPVLQPALQPVLVPVPQARPLELHLAFGRRKDNRRDEDDEPVAEDASGELDTTALPPIPSARARGRREPEQQPEQQEDESLEDPVDSWRPLAGESEVGQEEGEPAAESLDPPATAADTEPSSWSESAPEPEVQGEVAAGSQDPPVLAGDDPGPWVARDEPEAPATFSPEVVDSDQAQSDDLAWLSGSGPAQPWTVTSEEAAPDAEVAEPTATLEAEEMEEIEPETPQPESLDSYSEPLAEPNEEAEPPWAPAIPAASPEIVFAPPPVAVAPEAEAPEGGEAERIRTRSFPLPEGEMIFRNLRVGFTDPARLLRHLAGEGHTGVMHVLGVDGSNSYVVLVDGYVVAVATDHDGSITTTGRIAFPNFPNSQDTINVITYGRQIARGLGLLLHAPLRFEGLGAMFVNLEGLRTYLSKYSSSGGLVVHSQEGTGVALFEEGKLVGAYADSNPPSADLGQLRELVKDLEAEIDVRFGGPRDLEPTPLDTLLSGHPL